ncbi:MAG: chemotaxis protein CheB [Terriglobia bacterium]
MRIVQKVCLNANDIEFAAINRWLSALGIRTLTEWDILVFLHRHGFTLLNPEQVTSFLGHKTDEIAAALARLKELGLIGLPQGWGGTLSISGLVPQECDKKRSFTHLMRAADSRTVRLAILSHVKERAKARNRPTRHKFPIVAFGGSAGAQAVLKEIVEHFPSRTDMAFVVVQHLAPQQESFLANILSRKTSMLVRQVEDSMRIEPKRIFVIPPNTNLTIEDEVLHLAPRTVDRLGQHRSIDLFFTSLALDRASGAISVVLSGMNNDGMMGTAAIKKAGGTTMAQQLDTAECAEMPRAAIEDGWVDFVETPLGIAQWLERISQGELNPVKGGLRVPSG